jgi:hypothetical protein
LSRFLLDSLKPICLKIAVERMAAAAGYRTDGLGVKFFA